MASPTVASRQVKQSEAEAAFKRLVFKIWTNGLSEEKLRPLIHQKETLRTRLKANVIGFPALKQLNVDVPNKHFLHDLEGESADAFFFLKRCVECWNVYPECQSINRGADGMVLMDRLFRQKYNVEMKVTKSRVQPRAYIPLPSPSRWKALQIANDFDNFEFSVFVFGDELGIKAGVVSEKDEYDHTKWVELLERLHEHRIGHGNVLCMIPCLRGDAVDVSVDYANMSKMTGKPIHTLQDFKGWIVTATLSCRLKSDSCRSCMSEGELIVFECSCGVRFCIECVGNFLSNTGNKPPRYDIVCCECGIALSTGTIDTIKENAHEIPDLEVRGKISDALATRDRLIGAWESQEFLREAKRPRTGIVDAVGMAIKYIKDYILLPRCWNCRNMISLDLDFTQCLCLECSICRAHICGFCLKNPLKDEHPEVQELLPANARGGDENMAAHKHVSICPSNFAAIADHGEPPLREIFLTIEEVSMYPDHIIRQKKNAIRDMISVYTDVVRKEIMICIRDFEPSIRFEESE